MYQTNFNFLSDRYELLGPIGKGASSEVYLARHLQLNRECAIKVSPKTLDHDQSVLMEARLLPSLHHKGIPLLYDYFENSTHIFLVEEYLSGESLDQFLLHQSFISTKQFFHFCYELLDIYGYLHTVFGCPLLYQDLKPEHIFISGDCLKLLDFDAIWDTANPGNNKSKGNQAFSSPEFLEGATPDVLSDIYTLGKLFLYLSNYLEDPISQNFNYVFNKATDLEPSNRYSSLLAFRDAIRAEEISSQKPHLSITRNIGIVGSFPGCGATHLAIQLVSYLNQNREEAFYFERNDNNTLNKMLPFLPMKADQMGLYVYHHFKGYPLYGPGIDLDYPDYGFHIYDFGLLLSPMELEEMDQILLVGSADFWRRKELLSMVQSLTPYGNKLKILVRETNIFSLHSLSKELHSRIYPIPFSANAFYPEKKHRRFLHNLLS